MAPEDPNKFFFANPTYSAIAISMAFEKIFKYQPLRIFNFLNDFIIALKALNHFKQDNRQLERKGIFRELKLRYSKKMKPKKMHEGCKI